ncbi:hypothetical protein P3W45_001030 [Vairimorpha bombi]|jgi:hypothetical protein
MEITRKKLIKSHTLAFIKAITEFKSRYKLNEHFKNNLVKVNENFIRLRNVLRNENPYKHIYVQEICHNDYVEYFVGNIKLIKHNIYGFISVDTGNVELNKFLFKQRSSDLVEICKYFIDFQNILCDYCGKFDMEIPKNKVMDGVYILSFHDYCYNIINK